MISRGCPYHCTYCFNSTYNEIYKLSYSRIVRWRSIPNVIAEMKKIKQEGIVSYFLLADDAINLLPKQYIYEFCSIYRKEISLPFSAQFRADLIEENVVRALKEAGMDHANCGIECGDEEVSRNILKRRVTNDQIRNAFRIFNKHGIKNFSQNIVGLPVENPIENALKTIRLNIECKVTYAHFTLLIPFPKTPIERFCKENGYLPESRNIQSLSPSVFTESLLKYRTEKDNRQIDNLHKFCSIVVRYPFLLPFVRLLIKLPRNRFFQYIYFLWFGYNRSVVLYKTKISFPLFFSGIKQILNYLKRHY